MADDRVEKKKRRYCNHCDDYVSIRTYNRHRVEIRRELALTKVVAVNDTSGSSEVSN